MTERSMLSFVETAMEAPSIEALWKLHTDDMASYGFTRLIYGLTTSIDSPGFGDLDDLVVLSNHEAGYLDRYLRDGMYLRAPMVTWARDNVGSKSWSWIGEIRDSLGPAELAIIKFNQDMGVRAGYSISFPVAAAGKKAAIGLAAAPGLSQADVQDIWSTHGRTIEAKNAVFNLKLLTLPFGLRARNLTDRQREVLEWVGKGHTLQEIAQGLGLTVATIEKHLRLAREVLAVDTTAQAVLKAAIHNQIYLVRG